MERNIGYVRDILGSADALKKVPVAVVLTKSDFFINASNEFTESPVYLENPYLISGVFDKQDCSTVSEHIKDWLFEIGENELLEYVDKMCPNNRYFAISATGGSVVEGSPESYCPHRVADPLIWLLNEIL